MISEEDDEDIRAINEISANLSKMTRQKCDTRAKLNYFIQNPKKAKLLDDKIKIFKKELKSFEGKIPNFSADEYYKHIIKNNEDEIISHLKGYKKGTDMGVTEAILRMYEGKEVLQTQTQFMLPHQAMMNGFSFTMRDVTKSFKQSYTKGVIEITDRELKKISPLTI
jgi:hypothetical protein